MWALKYGSSDADNIPKNKNFMKINLNRKPYGLKYGSSDAQSD